MKIPYKNIYDVLRINRFIVLSVVIGAFLTSAFSVYMVISLHRDSRDKAFVVNGDGNVIPLKLASQRENLAVEAKAHLELFHRYFYGLNANNYKNSLEKALWLGDQSVAELYGQKQSEGLYNRLLQYSLVQEVVRVDPKVDIGQEPYGFEVKCLFKINRGTVTDTYELTTTGNMVRVDRNFPHNTHGLLIRNFFENSLRKVETDEKPK